MIGEANLPDQATIATPSGQTPLFEAVAVSKRYPRSDRARGNASGDAAALFDVSIAIPQGAFVVVTGPSGGGKTTLLSMLGVLDRPTTGRVLFDGIDLSDASDAERSRVRRRIGFVFQSSPMIRGLSVWENVTYPLIPTGVACAVRRERAKVLLEHVGLLAMLDSRPETLSGGELQRVGVARALVASPIALLADEPTSNLDRRSSDAVATLLGESHRGGATVVVATHDLRLFELATVIVELDAGRRLDVQPRS